MSATCEVIKELYLPSPAPNVAAHAHRRYLGAGLQMEEVQSQQSTSDWGHHVRRRVSQDNGRTWGDWEVVFEEHPTQGVFRRSESGQGVVYDQASGMLVQKVFQRIVEGDPAESGLFRDGGKLFWDHGFYRLSSDDGRNWGEPRLLRFEEGADFDEGNWGDPEYLERNEMYVTSLDGLSDGSLLLTATSAVEYRDTQDEKTPVHFPSGTRPGCVGGVMCFLGSWDATRADYQWQTSGPLWVPRRVSTRGLFETASAELEGGRVLLVMRGSNAGLDPRECPGRKWCAVSGDLGRTWGEVGDLRYDSGEQFYSPSSMPALIRSSRTGRLYFVGNISRTPPEGNGPRYPLVIAEVDEEKVALRKDTVTVIDDRDPEQDSESVGMWGRPFENRETGDFELFLTRHHAGKDPNAPWTAGAYRYTLRF